MRFVLKWTSKPRWETGSSWSKTLFVGLFLAFRDFSQRTSSGGEIRRAYSSSDWWRRFPDWLAETVWTSTRAYQGTSSEPWASSASKHWLCSGWASQFCNPIWLASPTPIVPDPKRKYVTFGCLTNRPFSRGSVVCIMGLPLYIVSQRSTLSVAHQVY